MAKNKTRSGTSDQHASASRQSQKNDGNKQSGSGSGSVSGSASGSQSGNQSGSGSGGTRGGTPEQHAAAGRQSHKNDKR